MQFTFRHRVKSDDVIIKVRRTNDSSVNRFEIQHSSDLVHNCAPDVELRTTSWLLLGRCNGSRSFVEEGFEPAQVRQWNVQQWNEQQWDVQPNGTQIKIPSSMQILNGLSTSSVTSTKIHWHYKCNTNFNPREVNKQQGRTGSSNTEITSLDEIDNSQKPECVHLSSSSPQIKTCNSGTKLTSFGDW